MTISELIKHVGDENIAVQELYKCWIEAKYSAKKGRTEIKFGTLESFGQSNSKVALVLWFPKDKLP